MEKVLVISSVLSQMNLTWFNQPKQWSINGTTINVRTDGNTDFWQRTHYGFRRDNGHFFYKALTGDDPFDVTVNVRGKYRILYDQGGLMVRIDENNWIKCGVEYVDGQQFASAVVTVDGWSDWNVVQINSPEILRLKVHRDKEAVEISFAEGETEDFKMMRLAYFPVINKSKPMMVGVMCASPDKDTSGFDISFENLYIQGEPYRSSGTTLQYKSFFFILFILAYLNE